MAVSALAQLLDQQPTAYAEVLAACRAMGWNASPTAQPADIIDELPSNVLPFIRRMLALLIYGDGSQDSPAVVPVTERCYAQLVPRVTSPNYPAAGFPSDRDPFTHAPSIRDFAHLEQALSALSPRKITNGNATNGAAPSDGIPDGVSLAHLCCGNENAATLLKDDNRGWTMKNDGLTSLLAMLPAVTKAEVWCEYAEKSILSSRPTIKELYMPYIKRVGSYGDEYIWYNIAYGCADLEKIDMPLLEEWYPGYDGGLGTNSTKLTEINLPHLRTVRARWWQYRRTDHCMYGATNLEKIVVGTPTGYFDLFSGTNNMTGCDKLIDLEICGDGGLCAMSLSLAQWSPTLDSSNLDQFLQNFKTHIAERLTDNGSGKTLTLSQAVYDAIKDETHLFVFDEGTMTIYAYLTNIKHWTVTK